MKNQILFLVALCTFHLNAQITKSQVDDVVNRAMKAFNVPGIAVGIVKDGKIVLAKGYGVTNINTQQKTDANTLFGIASISKSFTSVALAQMIDQGKLNWDDKVIKYIPEFKMYNDYVTNEFTIRDLLTHRSGLGLGAGDLMIWPDGHDFTPRDIVRNIQYLKPVSAFRTKYDYDNLLYVIAGEVVANVSGKSWTQYVEENIMKPLQMDRSAASWNRLKDTTNSIVPHVPVDGKLQVIPRYTNNIFDAAAGIYTNVNDLSKYVMMQLKTGQLENGSQLFSVAQHKEMWTPQTVLPLKNIKPYKTLFKSYGLGWQLADVNGYLQVSHTGGLDGIVTQLIMFPEVQLGIIVLTNQQSGSAFNAISNTIKDSYLGIKNPDHVVALSADRKQKEDDADTVTEEVWTTVKNNLKQKIKRDFKKYTGTYRDNWFGDVSITEKNGRLFFTSKRSKKLTGEIFFYKNQNFVVKWDVRSYGADSHIIFELNEKGNVDHFKMKAISPLTDFSYDFHDLDFTRVSNSLN